MNWKLVFASINLQQTPSRTKASMVNQLLILMDKTTQKGNLIQYLNTNHKNLKAALTLSYLVILFKVRRRVISLLSKVSKFEKRISLMKSGN